MRDEGIEKEKERTKKKKTSKNTKKNSQPGQGGEVRGEEGGRWEENVIGESASISFHPSPILCGNRNSHPPFSYPTPLCSTVAFYNAAPVSQPTQTKPAEEKRDCQGGEEGEGHECERESRNKKPPCPFHTTHTNLSISLKATSN